MVTNIAKKSSADAGRNANKENDAGTSGGAGGGAGEGEQERLEKEAHNADNYDARQVRKCTKKKDQVDAFQERLLKAIEVLQPQVDVGPPPAPPPKCEYLDVALEAMAFKIREVVLKEEIIDVVEDLENLVSRACREKRCRMEMVKNPAVPVQHPLQEPQAQMYAGPQGPMAVPVPYNTTGNSNETTFYNFN